HEDKSEDRKDKARCAHLEVHHADVKEPPGQRMRISTRTLIFSSEARSLRQEIHTLPEIPGGTDHRSHPHGTHEILPFPWLSATEEHPKNGPDGKEGK